MTDLLLDRRGAVLVVRLNRPDAREGATAFVEKREPVWRGC